MDATLTLTYLLVGALLTNVLLKLWLNARQVRHVAQHRGSVPSAFAQQISLEDHQKAADYTLAKSKVSQIDILIDAAVLLGWTLMGGLSALNALILEFMVPGIWQQVVLVLAFSLVGGLIELPLSLYQTFILEQKFDFNKIVKSVCLLKLNREERINVISNFKSKLKYSV
jgi:STE24 endopeptidase